jgi:hypothetical protein
MGKREDKDFRMDVKELQTEAGTFTGYLSTFGNTDQQGDVVERGAFSRTLDRWRQKGKQIPLLWQHQELIGGISADDAVEDEHGLFIRGELEMKDPKSQIILEHMRKGRVNAMSIGYDVIQHSFEGKIRRLKELRLFEGSLVLWPANESAEIIAVKKKHPDDEDEALSDALLAVTEKANEYLKPTIIATNNAASTGYGPQTTTTHWDSTTSGYPDTVKQTEDRALSAELRAKLKDAIEALTPLLAESDSPNAAEGDSQEPGTDTPTPDPGELPSEDEDAKELLAIVRELADNLRRKGP